MQAFPQRRRRQPARNIKLTALKENKDQSEREQEEKRSLREAIKLGLSQEELIKIKANLRRRLVVERSLKALTL